MKGKEDFVNHILVIHPLYWFYFIVCRLTFRNKKMLEHPTNNRKFRQIFLRLNAYSVEKIGGVNPKPSSVWSRDLLGFVGVAIQEKTINSFATDSAHLL